MKYQALPAKPGESKHTTHKATQEQNDHVYRHLLDDPPGIIDETTWTGPKR